MIVVADDRARIVWCGWVEKRRRTAVDVVTLECVEIAGYAGFRHVPDLTYTAQDQTSVIFAALAGILADGATAGIPLTVSAAASSVTRDREYFAAERATVLTRVSQLAAVEDGFEWTIDTAWTDATHTAVEHTARSGYPMLGTIVAEPAVVFEIPSGIAGSPSSVFEVPGGVIDFELTEPGPATHVVAVGDGSNEAQTVSAAVIDTTAELALPRFEHVAQFTGVTVQATIDAHAEAEALRVFGTAQDSLALSSRYDQDPRFGSYGLGDTVRARIETAAVSWDEVVRVTGWSLDPGADAVAPVLTRLVV